jgi:colicin import membrane protein
MPQIACLASRTTAPQLRTYVRTSLAVALALPVLVSAQSSQQAATPSTAASHTLSDDRGASAPLTYGEAISRAIRKNIIFVDKFHPLDAPRAEVEVRTIPNGMVINVKVVKPSTMKSWDEAVVRAVWATDVLPLDRDGRVPQTLLLVFSPR